MIPDKITMSSPKLIDARPLTLVDRWPVMISLSEVQVTSDFNLPRVITVKFNKASVATDNVAIWYSMSSF